MNKDTDAGIPLAMIAAVAANGVIGRDNALPWRLPEDLRYFKRVTMGKPIIMGRRTWESIGRPLPGRDNIVVSADLPDAPPGVQVCATPADAVAQARSVAARRGADEIMLIGGGQLYAWALPLAHRLYLTLVHRDVEGDAYFPLWDRSGWTELQREDGISGDGLEYSLLVFERKPRRRQHTDQ